VEASIQNHEKGGSMRKLLLLLFVVPAICSAQSTYGTGKYNAGRMSLGAGVEFVMPVTSGFKDAYNLGIGGTVRGEYAFTNDVSGMLTAGYVSLSGKDVGGVTLDNGSMIPVTVGVKYYFMPGTLRFYGAFDLGITSFKQSFPGVNILGVNIGETSQTSTEFTWQPQLGVLGYFSNNAAFDLSVRWIGISDANALGIRLGVLFDLGGGSSTGTGY
jgi:hypothetical protein